LPKFLDDRDAARLMAAACTDPDPRTRLVVEMLARTGLRAGELCDLAADAVTEIGDNHWLRVPVGKLRNDRYIPLHLDVIVLLADWTAINADHIRTQRRLIADHRASLEGRAVHRIVRRVAKRAGIGHVHPHQLRRTLATQAINRGMRLEVIAALLGHRSMEMTLTYAPDDGNDVAHTPAAPACPDSNSLRCHRSTRASMSTMSHQLAASRGLPQTAPGLAMQASVASQSYDSPGTGRTARVAAPS
jgi:integrase